MSVWLTPDLKPFYGGTYFPPTSQWGRPAFVDALCIDADINALPGRPNEKRMSFASVAASAAPSRGSTACAAEPYVRAERCSLVHYPLSLT